MLQLHHGGLMNTASTTNTSTANSNSKINSNHGTGQQQQQIVTPATTTPTSQSQAGKYLSEGNIEGAVEDISIDSLNSGTISNGINSTSSSAATIDESSKVDSLFRSQHQQHQQQQLLPPTGNKTKVLTTGAGQQSLSTSCVGGVVTPVNVVGMAVSSTPPDNALGHLKYEQELLYLTENCTVIGRNSSTSLVHFHVAENNLVSRKHFQLVYNNDSQDFYVQCLSKNGIFVDDYLQRRNAEPLKLPQTCYFRFPSTEIRIQFENYFMGTGPSTFVGVTSGNMSANRRYNFNINGTISAANSCPASPRHSFHNNNHPNYNYNNNLQNQDLFQTPSTATYNHNEKPPYSYAQLIVQAISAAPEKQLTLSGIYSFIVKHYPYYRKETNKGWQNSIRHNLSLNRYFIKVARSQDEPGKGSFWRIDPDSGAKLIDHSYKKRRQRSSQSFRPSYGMPRSAPVSPSHIDNSRESSPLQDIVLQSAPGSPGMSIENRPSEHELTYHSQTSVTGDGNTHNHLK